MNEVTYFYKSAYNNTPKTKEADNNQQHSLKKPEEVATFALYK